MTRQPIVSGDIEIARGPGDKRNHVGMSNDNAFWNAGRSGCVQNISSIVGLADVLRQMTRFAADATDVENRSFGIQFTEESGLGTIGQNDFGIGGLDDHRSPRCWTLRVDRNISASGPEDSENGCDRSWRLG